MGNSMPIRDMDMYAVSPQNSPHDLEGSHGSTPSAWASPRAGLVGTPVLPGVPTTANRGASGIDGVLSSAAG